ncbi:deoxyribonuclease IV [Thermodesulforhabdus norvegica]|uniref:Probable endonuclease 4 n=1 Tax=Thermodesulforhabdus norvegica TaxID=39841 RepID=A0A1I4TSC0_9BACT|nr:deoxyribonuclease IV [Thermodesulforhabdus norvegica]SFM79477.1 Endonuclease IV [Thermodesulforhabdus norvegica]
MALIGAHMSIVGGYHRAIERLIRVNGDALQIFCKNQRRWDGPPVTPEDVIAFRSAWQDQGLFPVAVHAGYLINLASPDANLADLSVRAFSDELERTASLGISVIVLHPGAHRGSDPREAQRRTAYNLDRAISAASLRPLWVLLETTAGQGTSIGATFEELADIMEKSAYSHCLGICFDTAHVFAAGYDISNSYGYENTLKRLDDLVGLDRVRLLHLNDSRTDCGSRIDRHEHIGKGRIGLEAFRRIVNDPTFAKVPMIIETPKGGGLERDRENISLLKSLVKGS